MAAEQQIRGWFEHFHANPEVSWKETETTQELMRILTDLGVAFHIFDDVTGVIAEIGKGIQWRLFERTSMRYGKK